MSRLFTPARINRLELRNRIIRAAAFEGMSPEGQPSDELIAYHRKVAAGGAAMSSVAYVSVSEDGRTYGHQMCMQRDGVATGLKALTDAVHAEGAAAAIQLGHCGYFADRKVTGHRPIAPSRVFCTYGLSYPRAMTGNDIARVIADFATSARLAREAGFDAIELHAGHGYLLSQFLSPFNNRRKDEFGGDLESRLRFPLGVVRAVREAVGPDYPLLAKTNLRDGFSGGLDIDEAIEVHRAFEREGLDALILSGGHVAKMPWYVMRGERPIREMVRGEPKLWRKTGLFLFGRTMVKPFEFEEGYFLEDSRRIREAVELPLVVVGGIRRRAMMEAVLDEGFEFVSMARPLIMEPDLPNKMMRGEAEESQCEPCNKCIAVMDQGGIRCVLREEREGIN